MRNTIVQSSEELDRADGARICRAIGEKLRQNLVPEQAPLPRHLQLLFEKLQAQDRSSPES